MSGSEEFSGEGAGSSRSPHIAMIWAQTESGVIGVDGDMPWHLPEDFAHFKASTLGSPVIMGRTTWESLPPSSRPLPGRTNIVLTRSTGFQAEGAHIAGDIVQAIALAGENLESDGKIWVIGGGTVYEQFMQVARELVVTIVSVDVHGDVFAPQIPGTFTLAKRTPGQGWMESRTGIRYAFVRYVREGEDA